MFWVYFILCLVISANADLSLNELKRKNELKDTTDEKVNMLMSNIEQHCHADLKTGGESLTN